jgi:hypothetical protein
MPTFLNLKSSRRLDHGTLAVTTLAVALSAMAALPAQASTPTNSHPVATNGAHPHSNSCDPHRGNTADASEAVFTGTTAQQYFGRVNCTRQVWVRNGENQTTPASVWVDITAQSLAGSLPDGGKDTDITLAANQGPRPLDITIVTSKNNTFVTSCTASVPAGPITACNPWTRIPNP